MRVVVWQPESNPKQKIFLEHMMAGSSIQNASQQAGITWSTGKRWVSLPQFQGSRDLYQKDTQERITPTGLEMEEIKSLVFNAASSACVYLTQVVKDPKTDTKIKIDISKYLIDNFFVPIYNAGSLNKPDEQVENKSTEIETLFLSVG